MRMGPLPHPGLSLQFHGTPSSRAISKRGNQRLTFTFLIIRHAPQLLEAILMGFSSSAGFNARQLRVHEWRQLLSCREPKVERGGFVAKDFREECNRVVAAEAEVGDHLRPFNRLLVGRTLLSTTCLLQARDSGRFTRLIVDAHQSAPTIPPGYERSSTLTMTIQVRLRSVISADPNNGSLWRGRPSDCISEAVVGSRNRDNEVPAVLSKAAKFHCCSDGSPRLRAAKNLSDCSLGPCLPRRSLRLLPRRRRRDEKTVAHHADRPDAMTSQLQKRRRLNRFHGGWSRYSIDGVLP